MQRGTNYTTKLSEETKKERAEGDPCYFCSAIDNEKGIEGVFRWGFDTKVHEEVLIFFQIKMYKKISPAQILEWLVKADTRAKELGLEEGSYVIKLFVTGAIEANIKDLEASWPTNCMVFGTEALRALVEPFGKGIVIDEIIRMKSR